MFYEKPSGDQSTIEWFDGSLGEETEDKNEVVALTNVSIIVSTPFYSGLLAQGSGLASMINHAVQGLWGTSLPDEPFQYFSAQANSLIESSTANFDYELHLNDENGITTSSSHGVNNYYAYQGDQLVLTISTNTSNELIGICFESLNIRIHQENETKDFEASMLKGGFESNSATPLSFFSDLTSTNIFNIIKNKSQYNRALTPFELTDLEIILFLIFGSELTKKSR